MSSIGPIDTLDQEAESNPLKDALFPEQQPLQGPPPTVPVYDHELKKWIHLTRAEASLAFQSNRYSADTGFISKANVVMPAGNLGHPQTPQEFYQFISMGGRLETEEEERTRWAKKEFSGVGGTLEAGAFGVGQALTLGLLGVADPQYAKDVERGNTPAKIVGEVAGFLAPMGVAGKAGRALLGATPLGLATTAGRKVAAATAGNAILKQAAGFATEGALIGSAIGATDVLTKNPQASAEYVLSEMLHGGLVGGLFSGAFGAAPGLLQKTATRFTPVKAKDFVGGIQAQAKRYTDEAVSWVAEVATGNPSVRRDVKWMLKQPGAIKDQAYAVRAEIKDKWTSTLVDEADAFHKFRKVAEEFSNSDAAIAKMAAKVPTENRARVFEEVTRWYESVDTELQRILTTEVLASNSGKMMKDLRGLLNKEYLHLASVPFDDAAKEVFTSVTRVNRKMRESLSRLAKVKDKDMIAADNFLDLQKLHTSAGELLAGESFGAGGKAWKRMHDAASEEIAASVIPGKSFSAVGEESWDLVMEADPKRFASLFEDFALESTKTKEQWITYLQKHKARLQTDIKELGLTAQEARKYHDAYRQASKLQSEIENAATMSYANAVFRRLEQGSKLSTLSLLQGAMMGGLTELAITGTPSGVGAIAGATLSVLARPEILLKRARQAYRMTSDGRGRIAKSTDQLFSSQRLRTGKDMVVTGARHGTAKALVTRSQKEHEERMATMKTIEQAQRIAANPQEYIQTMIGKMGDLFEDAPGYVQAIAEIHTRGALFLSQKAAELGLTDIEPQELHTTKNRLQALKFQDYLLGATQPMKAIQSGVDTMSKETVEALKVVWPTVYADVVFAFQERLAKHPYKKNSESVRKVGRLLGLQSEKAYNPEYLAHIQASFAVRGGMPGEQVQSGRPQGSQTKHARESIWAEHGTQSQQGAL